MTATTEAAMPTAEPTSDEAPDEEPLEPEPDELLLPLEPEPELPVEAAPEAEPELEARPVDEALEAEAVLDEATDDDDEGTMDLMPLEMVAVVLQFEVEGVE